jgi:hypothetical protein
MTLDEILLLPLVETYELDDEPADFDDLRELCDEFLEFEKFDAITYGCVGTEFMFPVGEGEPDPNDICEGQPVIQQSYDIPKLLQESPLVFSVEEGDVTDYGVVQGTTLFVYRHKA